MKTAFDKKCCVLALGAESAGIFAVYKNGNIFISENFGDLLEENNFLQYKKTVLDYLKKEKIKLNIVLTDLHPLYKTTILGEELAKKYKAPQIKIQHHFAHVFSAVGDFSLNTKYEIPNTFYGIALDGTGYGLDGNVWGGEIFKISNDKFQMTNQCQNPKSKMKIKKDDLRIERIGSLEEQIMIGGDLAVKEPARMLIAILARITNSKFPPLQRGIKGDLPNKLQITNTKTQKDFIYKYVKKFYTRNEFEMLYNQMEQNFNCQITTSAGRVLDAVSVLLGFSENERKYKHEAVKKLEENSDNPYGDIESQIKSTLTLLYKRRGISQDFPLCKGGLRGILQITLLFEYLIKNIHKDKRRLAATAQKYIAEGLFEIIKNHDSRFMLHNSCFAAGGMANNKIISAYLEKQGVYLSKKIPRGDEGIVFGQIVYYLLNNF